MQHACTLPLPLCTLLPSTPSLHLRFPHFPPAPSPSQLQPPTRIDLHHGLACPLTQLQPLTATQPPSLHLHEQGTHRKTHFKPLHTHSHRPSQANHATLPYFTNFTLPYHTTLTIPTSPWRAYRGLPFLSLSLSLSYHLSLPYHASERVIRTLKVKHMAEFCM